MPDRLKASGWDHVGDPDSSKGYVFDAYQGPPDRKMFEVTAPDGTVQDHVHALTAGEMLNNSFVAVCPSSSWMLSGEWSTVDHLLIFPTPVLNPAHDDPGVDLPLAGRVTLDHPIRNVQGATFVDDTTVLCSTDDHDGGLWPVPCPLLEIRLARPLDGDDVAGEVRCLGGLPLSSICPGTCEVEGLDYDVAGHILRVVVVPPWPCKVLVAVHCFQRTAT